MKHFIYFLLFLLLPLLSTAQNWRVIKPTNTGITGELVRLGKFDPQGNLWVAARWPFWMEGGLAKFDGTRWTPYSNVDSWMPTSFVNCIDFQPNGTAWIGTDVGLIRFDGTTSQVFNMTNTPLPSNNITDVIVDGSGNIWCMSKSLTTTAHGVLKYNGTSWTLFDASNSAIPNFDITTIGIDLNDHLWVGTWAGGIAKFNGSSWTTYNSGNSNFNNAPVTAFGFPSNGDVWVTTHSGVYKFSNNTWELAPAPGGTTAYSTVACHPDGSIWFGTYGGDLVKYAGSIFTSYNYGNHLYSIDFDAQGNVWAGGLAYIKKYVNGVNTLTYNVYNTSLTSYFIDGIDFAPNGKAWFATSMGGVCSYDNILWQGYNPDNFGSQPWTFPNNSASDIFIDKQNGTIWVASNGVGYWNGSGWTIFDLSNANIPDNDVDVVTKDLQNRVWIGTGGYGAAFYNGTTWTPLIFGSNYNANTINDIETAPDGSVWIGSNNGLHKTIDGINYSTFTPDNSGLPGYFANAIAFESNGTMWVGTDQGLARFDGSNWTVYTQSNSGLPANFVSDVIITGGNVWTAAHNTQVWPYYGGIARFNGTGWNTYTPDNSPLTHLQVEKLKADPSGNIWISTYSQGLMVYEVQAAALPVHLLSFYGKSEEYVKLFWETAFEQNSDKFVIERKTATTPFESIGSIAAAGNTQHRTSYSFTDTQPVSGTAYYRLKISDKDGQFEYSKVIRIDKSKELFVSVYPNPASSMIQVSSNFSSDNIQIIIYDALGRLVIRKQQQNSSLITVPVEKLKAGLYTILLSDGSRKVTGKFVKRSDQ